MKGAFPNSLDAIKALDALLFEKDINVTTKELKYGVEFINPMFSKPTSPKTIAVTKLLVKSAVRLSKLLSYLEQFE